MIHQYIYKKIDHKHAPLPLRCDAALTVAAVRPGTAFKVSFSLGVDDDISVFVRKDTEVEVKMEAERDIYLRILYIKYQSVRQKGEDRTGTKVS